MKSLLAFAVMLLVLLDGCNSQPTATQKYETKKPAWITNPNIKGNVGAVGVAGMTYDQKESTKRKLAISRALDELSLQQGVEVKLNISKKDIVKNDVASTSMNTQSSYKANAKVTAHIQSSWQDPLSGELFIWMVMD